MPLQDSKKTDRRFPLREEVAAGKVSVKWQGICCRESLR